MSYFDIPAGDVSSQIIGNIFGGMGIFESGGDPLVSLIGLLASAILIFAGAIFAYFLLTHTVNTAHEGEVVHKKFGVWAWIRLPIALSSLLPVVNGYPVICVIVAWIVGQGIGLGDAAANKAIDSQNLAKLVSTSFGPSPVKQTAYDLFLSGVCMATLSSGVNADKQSGGFLNSGSEIGSTTKTDGKATIISYGDKNEYANLKIDECGSAQINNDSVAAQSNSKIVSTKSLQSVNGVYQSQTAAFNTLVSTMMNLGSQQVNSGQAISHTQIDQAISVYQQTVSQAALNAVNQSSQNNEIQDAVKANGWIYFGFFYPRIQAIRQQVIDAINDVPTTTGPVAFNSSSYGDTYARNMQIAAKTVIDGNAIPRFGNGKSAQSTGLIDKITSFFKINVEGTIKSWFGGAEYHSQGNTDPLTSVSTWGGILMVCGAVAGAALAAIMAIPGINETGLGLLAQVFLQGAVPLLMATGYTMTYGLPLLPSLIWIGATLGFFIMATEAIIASVFWGLMILSPSGDNELIGAGIQGLRMIFALAFKPLLLVIGFTASIVFMNSYGVWVVDAFSFIFDQSMAGSNWVTYVVGLIFKPFVYLIVMTVVVHKIFSITHALPDAVLTWISGGSSFGGHAQSTSGNNVSAAPAAAVGGLIGGTAGAFANLRNKNSNGGGSGNDKIKNEERNIGSSSGGGHDSGERFNVDGSTIEQSDSGSGSYSDIKSKNPNGNINSVKGSQGSKSASNDPKSGMVTQGKNGFSQYGGNSTAPNPSAHKASGEVVGFGNAPYKHDPENKPSFYVSVKGDDGQIRDVWGAGLKDEKFTAGERVSIEKSGEAKGQELTTKTGETITHKNKFDVERLPKQGE